MWILQTYNELNNSVNYTSCEDCKPILNLNMTGLQVPKNDIKVGCKDGK